MAIVNAILSACYSRRLRAIERFVRRPAQVQAEQFRLLMGYGGRTRYLGQYGVTGFTRIEEFARTVPIVTYDQLQHPIERVRRGERDLLWPGRVQWFAKSSGTTGDRSKYIPVTRDVLQGCHYQGGRDALALFVDRNPDSKAFSGKSLTLGGSHRLDPLPGGGGHCGDLSAIMIHHMPRLASWVREPAARVALLPDFEAKIEAICRRCVPMRMTSFVGVPSWNLVLMNRVLEYTGRRNLLEVWPGMSLFVHGGVSFKPYREQYQRLLPSPRMKYMETYNASEGFFALQDDLSQEDMLLMLDYGVFYEFLPVRDLDRPEQAVPLEGVERGVNYAMIISTCGGLWRYMLGDTVEFTHTAPYKIRITGRTKSYINAFGEELIIDNAERGIAAACAATGAKVTDYTAAPIYMQATAGGKGAHQWLVEFDVRPADVLLFAEVLDRTLGELNSDYGAKREGDSTLLPLQLVVAGRGLFYRWMESRQKLGGQNKVPRLANDRQYMDELLKMNSL